MDYFYGVNRVSRLVTGDGYVYNITESYYDEEADDYIETIIPVNGYHEYYAYDGRGNAVHTMALDNIDLYITPHYNQSSTNFPEADFTGDGMFDLHDLNYASNNYPIVRSYYYSPFGEIWQGEVECDTNPFRYAGEYLDKETGDIYLRARYYNPSIGRFITVDPIKDGTNWYVYCGNNPIAFVDPRGLYQISTDNYGRVLVYIEEGDTLEQISLDLTGSSENTKYINVDSSAISVGDIIDITNMFNTSENAESSTITVNSLTPDGGDSTANNRRPSTGEPGSTYTTPKGDSRTYGPDGKPEVDVDQPHGHNPEPHIHRWPNGVRGPAEPLPNKATLGTLVVGGIITVLEIASYYFGMPVDLPGN